MKNVMAIVLLLFFAGAYAQSTGSVSGIISDVDSSKALESANVSIANTRLMQTTDQEGKFVIINVPVGNQLLVISKDGYDDQQIPINIVNGQKVDIGNILMSATLVDAQDQGVIVLSDDALSDDEAGSSDNISGILQSSKDVFQRTAAFNWGQVWFKTRGYDSNLGQVSFNGIPMNKISNNRPQWSDWGGLNDVLRNQTFTDGLAPAETSFGGVLGSTNFITRASQNRQGGRISYAQTNSNYDQRVMASYNTGLMQNGWALSVLGSRRLADEGYMEGSSYNAWSGFIAAEKKLNDKHSLNFTAFYTPNRRGKNSPNTQEVFDLGGTKYNAYWGYQGALQRNSRMKEIKEPTFMVSDFWTISDKTSLNTNVMYQYGTISNTRLDYLGLNPDPTYYQKLPSYFLSKPGQEDYQEAYIRTRNFLTKSPDSQIIWQDLYEANALFDDAVYTQYADVNNDKVFAANSVLSHVLTDHIDLNASILYKSVSSENYAEMVDLLGAKYFTDVNKFALEAEKPNDLNNPDNKVTVGDKFKYDYLVNANIVDAFAQAGFNYNKVDFYFSGNLGNTSYQRDGLFKNGEYANSSFGKSEQKNFLTYGIKSGMTYKVTGNHLFNINAGYMTKAPSLRNTFANSRVSNDFVPNVTTQKISSADVSYYYRDQSTKLRLTGYYTYFKDMSEVSFFYAEGLSGTTKTNDFLTTALYGIDKKNMGLEFGFETKINSSLKIMGAAAIGQYTYDNNPSLQIATSEQDQVQLTSYLKDYKQSGGPQKAYSFGMEYRDPNYWWFSANANILTDNYASLSAMRRTDNFYKDEDGMPIAGVTQADIDEILVQERFDNIFLVNVVGGKSWRINHRTFGFFASINNLLGEIYKSGGFEQSRKANYTKLKEDMDLDQSLFGNKYWYGRGTSYYLNFYIRF